MRALITGSAGFVGAHLARHLLRRGSTVAGLVLPQEVRRGLESLPEEVEVIEGDILDAEKLARTVADWKPLEIYHLAAFSNPQGFLGTIPTDPGDQHPG